VSLFEDDLATMFADPVLSDSASIGVASTSGFLDWEDILDQDGSGFAPVRRRVFTFELGSSGGRAFDTVAVRDALVSINGTTYKVRDNRHVAAHQKKLILA
jgi:hypothetical protein